MAVMRDRIVRMGGGVPSSSALVSLLNCSRRLSIAAVIAWALASAVAVARAVRAPSKQLDTERELWGTARLRLRGDKPACLSATNVGGTQQQSQRGSITKDQQQVSPGNHSQTAQTSAATHRPPAPAATSAAPGRPAAPWSPPPAPLAPPGPPARLRCTRSTRPPHCTNLHKRAQICTSVSNQAQDHSNTDHPTQLPNADKRGGFGVGTHRSRARSVATRLLAISSATPLAELLPAATSCSCSDSAQASI